MTESDVIQQITGYDGVELDARSTDQQAIYSVSGRIMAVVKKGAIPVQVSLRCDPNLGQLLRDRYESVLEGQGLNKRRFITILLTGQLSDDDVRSQIRHAYEETRSN